MPDNSEFCRICGSKILKNDRFCDNCGNEIKNKTNENKEEELEPYTVTNTETETNTKINTETNTETNAETDTDNEGKSQTLNKKLDGKVIKKSVTYKQPSVLPKLPISKKRLVLVTAVSIWLAAVVAVASYFVYQGNLKVINAVNTFYSYGSYVIITLTLVLLVYLYLSYGKAYRTEYRGKYFKRLPEECTPAVAGVLCHFRRKKAGSLDKSIEGSVGLEDMVSTILDLERRGYISIDIETGSLIRISDTDSGLYDHEKLLMGWLFDRLGDGKVTDKDMIDSYTTRYDIPPNKYKAPLSNGYELWKHNIYRVLRKMGYFDMSSREGRLTGLIPGYTIILIGAAGFWLTNPFPYIELLKILVSGLVLVYVSNRLMRRSYRGQQLFRKFQSFVNYLCNFHKIKVTDLPGHDQMKVYLVYAKSLGIFHKVLKKLKKLMEGGKYPDFSDELYNFVNKHNTVVDITNSIYLQTEDFKMERKSNVAGDQMAPGDD